MKLNCRYLWKKFQRDGFNVSNKRWIITQYQIWLSEEEFNLLHSFQGFQNHQNLHYDPYGQHDQKNSRKQFATYAEINKS